MRLPDKRFCLLLAIALHLPAIPVWAEPGADRELDGLPIIAFNKPERYWDGTETLSYSYRLNVSYHPRYDYAKDIAAMAGKPSLIVVGEGDVAVDGEALRGLFAGLGAEAEVAILPGVSHFGVFGEASALERMGAWLRSR